MLTTAQLATDEQKLTQSTITLAAFFTLKYTKGNANVTAQQVFEKLKAGFDNLNLTTPPTDAQLVKAIFTVMHYLANISKVKSLQEIDKLAEDVYGLLEGDPDELETLIGDIRLIFKKQPVVELLDSGVDLTELQGAFTTILAYGLSKLPANAETTTESIVSDIKAGIDGINTPPSPNDAIMSVFALLEVTADLSGKASITKLEAFLQNIYQIFGSNTTGNNFVHFFQEIKALIALRKATKAV